MKIRSILLNTLLFALLGLLPCGCQSGKAVATASVEVVFCADELWVLSTMNGRKVKYVEGQEYATLSVNPEAGTVSGCNGCNRFFGTFKDLGKGKMIVAGIGSTKMACPEAFHKVESSFMQLLRKCDGYRLDAYTLELLQGDKVLLVFDKEQ